MRLPAYASPDAVARREDLPDLPDDAGLLDDLPAGVARAVRHLAGVVAPALYRPEQPSEEEAARAWAAAEDVERAVAAAGTLPARLRRWLVPMRRPEALAAPERDFSPSAPR